MATNEHTPLLGNGGFRAYPSRFYILGTYSMLTFFQSTLSTHAHHAHPAGLIWLTYSPIADEAEAYYGISEATTELLLNWGGA